MIDSPLLGLLPSSWKGTLQLLLFSLWSILPAGCEKPEDQEPQSDLIRLTDYDGNTYFAKQIGDQWWMVNNLRTTRYSDGEQIMMVESPAEWAALNTGDRAYCYYDNNQGDEARIYGALYTWAAAMGGAASSESTPSGIQGVCPDGWHLPSDREWMELEMHPGGGTSTPITPPSTGTGTSSPTGSRCVA